MTQQNQSNADEASGDSRIAGGARTHKMLSRSFPAVAPSVARIRAAVASYAVHMGAGQSLVEGVTLAVSEAASNVVVHAYTAAGGMGLIHVEASVAGDELRVSVADAGPGLRPGGDGPGLGLGLVIIGELADKVELLQVGTGGLRVLMRFALPAAPISA